MANLPNATTTVQDTAGAVAGGLDVCCVWSPCATSADATPRLFGNAAAIYAQHGYCEGLEYAALHFERTGKAVLFVGLPIATPGAISREDTSGNTGSSVSSVTAGGDGVLGEHDGVLTVDRGGTIGTDQISLLLSLDGGKSEKKIRLGVGTSFALPYVGATVSFAAGTLVAGDVIHTWHGSAPRSDSDGWADAITALGAQAKGFRSTMLVGDLQNDTEAAAYLAQLDAYETAHKRFIYGRASVRDRLPLAALAQTHWQMTGSPTLTFAEVGGTGDTITRSAGSWIADGAVVGDTFEVVGSVSNDGVYVIASLSATVITLGSEDLDAEVAPGCTVTGTPTLTFANSGDTITRNRGSWLADGFRVGSSVTVDGSDSGTNDGTFNATTVTALVLTLASGAVDADEVSPTSQVSVTAGQTKAAWMADIEADFAPIDDAFRIDMSAGRGRVLSPFSGWNYRRPAGWAASLREYQHDLHIATWRKDDGPTGFDLYDSEGTLAEWDDRVDGSAACAARFTAFRTHGNGPQGAFIALSLTRGNDGSLLSLTHNVAVVNLACTVAQLNTEKAIGRSMILNADGTATKESLSLLAAEVNSALNLALLVNARGEGPRASLAKWTPSTDDVLNVPEATLTGVLELHLNGTIHSVVTTVRVVSGGQ